MIQFSRYAVYYLPEPGQLADFAAGWLGWDPVKGRAPAPVEVAGLPRPRAALTEMPRRYGFHATLKPPFRLAPGSTADDLSSDLASLTARLPSAGAEGLRLAGLGRFLALVPEGDSAAIGGLAAKLVVGLDRHRAPAAPEEHARRAAAGLTARQAAHLARWGYPYVIDEFRFHLTLTGKLGGDEVEPLRAALAPALAPLLPHPFQIGAVSLCGEDPEGHFHQIARYPLAG